jgi:hypothetical protein
MVGGFLIDISACVGYTARMSNSLEPKLGAPEPKRPISIFQIAKNERVHKVFIIHDRAMTKTSTRDYRILTKEKADGMLELIAYQYEADAQREWQIGFLRAPAVPPDKLLDLIRGLVSQTKTHVKQMEVLDLTVCKTRLDQADKLAQHDLLDAFDFE